MVRFGFYSSGFCSSLCVEFVSRRTLWRKNIYHVSVKEKEVAGGGNDNPFHKHGKYSQRSTIYDNIYLPNYETVIEPNNHMYENPKVRNDKCKDK